jgi:hypothetical protein
MRSEDEEKTIEEKYAHAGVEEIMEELQWVQGWLQFEVKELLPNDEYLDRARAMLQDIDTYWMQPLRRKCRIGLRPVSTPCLETI